MISQCSPDGAELAERNPGSTHEPLISAFGLASGLPLLLRVPKCHFTYTQTFTHPARYPRIGNQSRGVQSNILCAIRWYAVTFNKCWPENGKK